MATSSNMPFSINSALFKVLKHPITHLFFIFLITIIAFSNIFPNQFVGDDLDFIVYWQDTKSWSGLPDIIQGSTPPSHTGVFRPIRGLFYLLMYQGFGDNIIAYHAFSIIVHLLSLIFIYLIIHKISDQKPLAFLTTIFFALHPIHVEAITFITTSFDLIGILFLFISWYLFLLKKSTKWHKTSSYYLSLIFATLAFFTYEISLVLPLILTGYIFIYKQKKYKNISNWIQLIPFYFILLIYLIIRFLGLNITGRGDYQAGSFYLTQLMSIKGVLEYIKLIIWPSTLSINHIIPNNIHSYQLASFNQNAILSQSFWQASTLIAIISIFGLIIYAFKKRKYYPIISFSIFWFFISLLPLMNLIPNSNIFAEKYLYLASFGYCLLFAYFILNLFKKNTNRQKKSQYIIAFISIAIISFYFYKTYTRNRDWLNEGTVWQSAISIHPNNSLLYFKLGTYFQGEGDLIQAEKAYQKAVLLSPNFAQVHFNLGVIYEQWQNYDQSLLHYQTSFQLYQDVDKYQAIGRILAKQNKKEELKIWQSNHPLLQQELAKKYNQ